jgi:hypothetical protein
MSELNFASNNPFLQKINGLFVTGEELFNGVFLLNIKISKLNIFSKQLKERNIWNKARN